MTYEEAKAIKTQLEAEVDRISKAWNAEFPRDPSWTMGLTPDHIKQSPAYRAYHAAYHAARKRSVTFSGLFVKTFAKEYRQERAERIARMTS